MNIDFSDDQMVGLQAACDKYNENYKLSMTVEEYTSMICQELATSMINKYVSGSTPQQSLALHKQVRELEATVAAVEAVPVDTKPLVP